MSRNNSSNAANRLDALSSTMDQLVRKVDRLTESHAELIRILGPLFPRISIDPQQSCDDIANAATEAENSAIATPLNPNLRGSRIIPKVLPEAYRRKTGKTASISLRLLALLKYLLRTGGGGGSFREITDEEVQPHYRLLKMLAVSERKLLIAKYPEYERTTSWSKVDKKVKNETILSLEAKASIGHQIRLHECEDSWAADRLMFESFRGMGKSREATPVTSQNSSSSLASTYSLDDFTIIQEQPYSQ